MAAYKQLSTIAHAQSVVWRVGEVALVGVLDESGALVELIEKRDQFGLFPVNLAAGLLVHRTAAQLTGLGL